jgi:hypothetical protein
MRYSLETKSFKIDTMKIIPPDTDDTLDFWDILFICLAIVLSPLLWVRWIFRAYFKKDWWALGIASISLAVFIIAFIYPVILYPPQPDPQPYTFEKFLRFMVLIGTLLTPPSYFLAKWILNSFKSGKRFLKIIGISFIALVVGGIVYTLVHFRIQNRVWMGENLGIHIPFSGSSIDYILYPKILDYPDGNVRATVQFDVQTAADLERQIKSIRYFGPERLALFGNNMLHWNKSYQLKCKEVKDYLYAKGVTGLWYFDTKAQVYRFYEPRIGRCNELQCEPNAQLLFNRSYRIVASLNPKTRTLYYQFTSYK